MSVRSEVICRLIARLFTKRRSFTSTSLSQVRETEMADDGVFRSGIMLRIGKTEDIERQYEEGYLKFSCPGTWIMYAKKNHDDGIADKYEAIFAHVKRDDPRLLKACNNDPANMALSLWCEAGSDDTIYARYVYSCLVPSVCFYSIAVKDVARYFGLPMEKGNWVEADYVKYDLDLNEEFIDPYPYKALFRKRPEFSEQREARMVIPGVIFLRYPYENPDKWEDHVMKVPVPGIKDYAEVIPAGRCERYRYVFP